MSLPSTDKLPAPPKRVICHWTAGAHRASDLDRKHYHLLLEHVEGDPERTEDDRVRWIAGVPIERNMRLLSRADTDYAAHTRGMNSYSIGVALCGMRGAVDRRPAEPVDPGPSPISRVQVEALIGFLWQMRIVYGLTPTPAQMHTHYEAETLHGVKQAGKWDITWLPGSVLGPDEVGPWIREQVIRFGEGRPVDWR